MVSRLIQPAADAKASASEIGGFLDQGSTFEMSPTRTGGFEIKLVPAMARQDLVVQSLRDDTRTDTAAAPEAAVSSQGRSLAKLPLLRLRASENSSSSRG